MSAKIACTSWLRLWAFGALVLGGCSKPLPPVPATAPSFEPFTAALEYERPAWSPDGNNLFFAGGPSGHSRLYRASTNGSGLLDVGNRLHCGQVAVHRAKEKLAYTAMQPNGTTEIWTASLDGSAAHQVTKGGYHSLPEWSPDGSQISFLSFPDGNVKVVSAEGGEVRTIAPSLSAGVWSPTDRRVAVVQGKLSTGNYEIVVMSLVDGTSRPLRSTLATNTPGLIFESHWMAFQFDWSPDGRLIVWPNLVDGRMQLVLIDVASDTIVKRLPTAGFATDPRFSPDGRWIAYASESSSHVRSLRMISVDGTDDRPVTQPVEFVKGEYVQYPGGGDMPIPSFLFRPQTGGKSKKPAIVWLHGGGLIGATLDVFDPAIQYFAANGFIVLAPNYRPSRGFSPELAAATGKDIADDVAAAAAYLKRLDDVDPARIVVFGASFGGYAVLRTITAYPSTFAAAVELNGPCDLSALYRNAPEHRPSLTLLLGGPPESQNDRYREESPVNYVDKISIPVLIIHGTADETVPYPQSQLLLQAMEKAGKKHKLLTYEGIGHGFPPPVWANAMQQCMAFLTQELSPQTVANPH